MNSDKDIYILGVGHNTPVYIDLVKSCGYNILGLYHYNDSRIGEQIHGYKIIDTNDNLFERDSLVGMNFTISVGSNKIRSELSNKIREKGGNIPTIIHPTAVVSEYAIVESGVVIHVNSVVQADATIRRDTVLSYNTSVSHNSTIGEACYLAFNSTIGAYIDVQNFVLIGQAAAIISDKLDYIGHHSIVGGGSVIINNVEPYSIVVGNPGKLLKKTNE